MRNTNNFRFEAPGHPRAAAEPPDFLVDANTSYLDTPVDSQLSTPVICARFPPGAFLLVQLHYWCIRPTAPNARRTPTAIGVEKEKRKACRRARGGIRIGRKVDERLGIVTHCGDRHFGFGPRWTCQVKCGKCCGFYCRVVGFLLITAACSHPDGKRRTHFVWHEGLSHTRRSQLA